MAGGKKKKSSSKKKANGTPNKGTGGKKNVPPSISLDDVLSQAESALEMANVEVALQLFEYAASVLRDRVHGDDATSSEDIAARNVEEDKKTLASALGKMGELKASMGNVDGARVDFLDAIELMGHSLAVAAFKASEDGTADNRMQNDESMHLLQNVDISLANAQHCEHVAGLYLYLGQLSSGCEALTSFQTGKQELQKAVSILERLSNTAASIKGDGNTRNGGEKMEVDGTVEMTSGELIRYLEETRRQLCSAHCSIAELYLTDLCDEPDAEIACEKELQSAMRLDQKSYELYSAAPKSNLDDSNNKLDPPPPDALQTMANLRMSQSRPHDAYECILKAYERMKVGCEAMSALVGLGKDGDEVEMQHSAQELVEVDAASSLPSYEFRCQSAKLFLECGSAMNCNDKSETSCDDITATKKCAETAIQILGSLMAENDEVVEVWYLLGCAFMALSPPNIDSAQYYWDQCMTMLIKVKEEMEECIDDDNVDAAKELEAIEQQIDEVKNKLNDLGMKDKMDDSL
ncbi:hypothetical protein HJC23_008341 [Cyclotella cryptica]|uniref:Uncharacterized protein n=1 Tax=Cyclotella cryptica TaxID=29204 RepID=A0ABD3Q6U4_9STRA|eukprot:CCRYP_008620-RB/>CCRYP_008620-RB protein AED:0.03 eAED:0.03 QI:4221/1/1/1/0.33/0.25/4/426/520